MEPCAVAIQDNPLVKAGEEYILFLVNDNRASLPNTSGSPRYVTVGSWSGKAKITEGKIQFVPGASKGLHQHDNTVASTFIAAVKTRVNSLRKRTP